MKISYIYPVYTKDLYSARCEVIESISLGTLKPEKFDRCSQSLRVDRQKGESGNASRHAIRSIA